MAGKGNTLIKENQLRRAWRTLIDFVLPPECAGCRAVGSLFCPDCYKKLDWVSEPICLVCGCAQTYPDAVCRNCREKPTPLTKIRAATFYSGPIPPAIWQMKYDGAFALAEPLADLMIEAWPRWRMPVDLVIPVALHPERERKRGYNQSTLLARRLSQRLGWQIVPDGLKRIRDTRPQTRLSGSVRLTNVRDAFWADAAVVAGKQILLVDDVATTGATLVASADALLAAGAVSVSGYCLARATEQTHTRDTLPIKPKT